MAFLRITACNLIVDNPQSRAKLLARMIAGTIAPGVECFIWYYAKGRPKDRVELGADKTLAQLVREAIEGTPDRSRAMPSRSTTTSGKTSRKRATADETGLDVPVAP